MLSIGKLAPGRDAASYYLDRVAEKGCPLDYYTGAGEAPGLWVGRGAERLGLEGALTTDRSQALLRDLLAGIGPDGQQLSKPVMRADPRGRVPTLDVAQLVVHTAAEKGVDVEDVLTQQSRAELMKAWQRSQSELDRAQRRPMWPAPSMPAATAQELLQVVGLDLRALPSAERGGLDCQPEPGHELGHEPPRDLPAPPHRCDLVSSPIRARARRSTRRIARVIANASTK